MLEEHTVVTYQEMRWMRHTAKIIPSMFQVNTHNNAFTHIKIYAHVPKIFVLIQVHGFNNLIIDIGGHVIHSYGRLVHRERVITRGDQLLLPGDVTGPGRMDCIRTAPETASFRFFGGEPPNNLVYQSLEDDDQMGTVTLFYNRSYLSMCTFKNVEGSCQGANHSTYFLLYLLPGNT